MLTRCAKAYSSSYLQTVTLSPDIAVHSWSVCYYAAAEDRKKSLFELPGEMGGCITPSPTAFLTPNTLSNYPQGGQLCTIYF